ncbi:hypothetical protein CWI38_0209p0060 [Hamiltosporidium tvaerminnensis]|uniref:Uncharacterized protein n=1 Tax=Hamiltosporidium tvaerminnensis TaxID=1176355 RepID=A0A4Q9M254_9MICR|nr:hypothetical protein CWI38_0209p0060 [Hamiltosporidium tvaerminnensis]
MAPKTKRRNPNEAKSSGFLTFKSIFWDYFIAFCMYMFEAVLPIIVYDKIMGLEEKFGITVTMLKYIMLSFLYNSSFFIHIKARGFGMNQYQHYLTVIPFIFISTTTELFIYSRNLSKNYEMPAFYVLLYTIFGFLAYFTIFINFNNCKFILKEVSIRTFLCHFFYVYILIIIDNLVRKLFIFNIKELLLLKLAVYCVEMILSYIYLIKRNTWKIAFLLFIYQFVFLFAMELNTLSYFYNNLNYIR